MMTNLPSNDQLPPITRFDGIYVVLYRQVWYVQCTQDCRQKNLIKTATKYEREHRRSSLNLGIIISSYLMKILKQHCLAIAIKLRSSDQSLSNDQCRLISQCLIISILPYSIPC
jgi:hypothetical protein